MTIPDTTPQRVFDREKHLSIGLALNKQRIRDIEASIAKVKAAEDDFRGLSDVEQQEIASNQGDTSVILNDIRRIKAERKQKESEDRKVNSDSQATIDTGAKPKIIQGTVQWCTDLVETSIL